MRHTAEQCRIARLLRLNVSGDSSGVAAAKILDEVAEAVHDSGKRPSTDRQRLFAMSLGLDVSGDSVRVASARISAVVHKRNIHAARAMRLRPGNIVVLESRVELEGRNHLLRELHVVSSVADGRVYFRGGNGAQAQASRLRLPTEEERMAFDRGTLKIDVRVAQ